MNDSSLMPQRVADPLQSGPTPRGQLWGIAADDWDLLFDAVQARLRAAAQDAPASALQATVFDCLTALGALHAALKEERGPPATGPAHDAADTC